VQKQGTRQETTYVNAEEDRQVTETKMVPVTKTVRVAVTAPCAAPVGGCDTGYGHAASYQGGYNHGYNQGGYGHGGFGCCGFGKGFGGGFGGGFFKCCK